MRIKQGLRWCWKCNKTLTYRRIDGVPICDKCLLSDARGGKVRDYSGMRAPKPKRDGKGRYGKI